MKSLLEVVQTGAKNIEISVMESYGKVTVRVERFYETSFPSQLMPFLAQILDLAQIEGIVSDIEREKEAGESYSPFYILSRIDRLRRGGEEAVETCCNCCWPGSHVSHQACRGRVFGAVVERIKHFRRSFSFIFTFFRGKSKSVYDFHWLESSDTQESTGKCRPPWKSNYYRERV